MAPMYGAPVQAAESPNIIMIVGDDQGVDAIEGAAWPNDLQCHTPNLAMFAANGRSFTNCRVNALCSPSRAMILSGRTALQTGVTNVIHKNPSEYALFALQGHERTIGEMLHDLGYYTLLIDKWHVGVSDDQMPLAQGFDVYRSKEEYRPLDDPIAVGDEHLTKMVEFAIHDVTSRPDPNSPYALFFWSSDPHSRRDQSGREPLKWWRVDESLLPSGEPYYHQDPADDTERDRYRAVVEAMDTEIGRMLYQLGVINANGQYRPESNTVVFYLGDNGTPEEVAPRADHAKGSLFEGGINVPLFVFGHNVPADGQILDRLISGLDLFDTIGDIVAAPMEMRGEFPRQGMSFADDIDPSIETLPQRDFTISSRASSKPPKCWVALADDRYKLICSGGTNWAVPLHMDAFYDMESDPTEDINLIDADLTIKQEAAYLVLRDAVMDHWYTAVSTRKKLYADIPLTDRYSITSLNTKPRNQKVGHINPGLGDAVEARSFYRFDVENLEQYLPRGRTIDDVVAARIILIFDSDSLAPDETDTGEITAYVMKEPWSWREKTWDELVNGHRADLQVGHVDLAPHVIWDFLGHSGVPVPEGAPISLGSSDLLLQLVRLWHADWKSNRGVVLIADPINSLPGDQSVRFKRAALLRLTLR
ncbi:MAG: sulfatase-like hydrolase/transferase [Planctomycetes bacterium]|nr:sulfatase-like hydrolase/transferase [Planctomycetota bacterium]